MPDSLIPEADAEARAHARIRDRDLRRRRTVPPALGTLEPLLAALEQRTPDPYTLRRVAFGAYEARTWAGDAGFGPTPAAAVGDLLDELKALA